MLKLSQFIATTRRHAAIAVMAVVSATAPTISGCAQDDAIADEFGLGDTTLETGDPLGKADAAHVKGPRVNIDTSATQVWDAVNAWEDTDTPAARVAGIAWSANSGLNWDEKYAAWIQSMPRQAGNGTYFETYTVTTPWGKTLPAPKLECAEMAMFMRITFAAWYRLPFFLTAVDGQGKRIYFGHFGARTATSRYKNTPNYGSAYADYSHMSPEQIAAEGWPRDEKLRQSGMYGGGDDMPFIEEGARAGAYFDELHLNKRAGHFTRLILAYFGSMHLASARNAYNLKPESVRAGDVLVERWKRRGIGHTLIVKSVTDLDGGMIEAQLASGSMPRRQPKWEDAVASKNYFMRAKTGGEGTTYDGEEYVKLGGGLKRFRVTKNIGGYWTNAWMKADESSWISDTDWEALKVRPARFGEILGEVDPAQLRDALIDLIEDKRNHLRQYPASCSARIGREEAFEQLYELMANEFDMDAEEVDAEYRTFEDHVFARLAYDQSKTCCWNSSTSAMFDIVMEYNESLQTNACTEPVVFKNTDGGYDVFRQYAEQTGRGHLWKPWSADESCPQADTLNDVVDQEGGARYCGD